MFTNCPTKRRVASALILAILSMHASITIAQKDEPKDGPFGMSASPNAKGPLAHVVTIVTPKRHTRYTFDEALTVKAEALARGVTELKYIRRAVELTRSGATVYTSVNQPKQMVDSENVDDVLSLIDRRLAEYQQATKMRGFDIMAPAYDVVTKGLLVPTLLEQDKGDLTWWDGESLHTGAIVEDTFVIANDVHTELTMIGRISVSDRINVQIWAAEFAWEDFANEKLISEIIWNPQSGTEARYAMAFVSRALFYVNQMEYEEALSDANEALKRDPELTTAYAIRSQILSSSPIDRMRDAEQALADVRRYGQLKQKDEVDSWLFHTLMAAALAESGHFSAAVTEARSGIDKAPDEMKGALRVDLDNYLSRTARRMPRGDHH